MKTAILYLRVAQKNNIARKTILLQEEQLRNHCKRENIKVIGVYREIYSGSTFNRPAFNKMLKKADGRCKPDFILVTTWTRFSRNYHEALAMMRMLKKNQIEVQALGHRVNPNLQADQLMLAICLAAPYKYYEVANNSKSD